MKCKKIKAPQGELKKICEELGMRGKMELGPIIDVVNDVLDDIKKNGDAAVFKYTKKFDKADIDAGNVRVTDQEIADAIASLDPNLVEVIKKAAANILAFHERQVETGFKMDVAKGAEIGMRVRPISVAGIYVPGGTAPLPSTVLMNVIPARAAGCPRIVLCTPPRDRKSTRLNSSHPTTSRMPSSA